MRQSLFTFQPAEAPAFELWAPAELRQRDTTQYVGALVADADDEFAPNLVVGHDHIASDMLLADLTTRLREDARALPGGEVRAPRTVDGTAGEVHIVAFTHDGPQDSGRLFQQTAFLLAPRREPPAVSGDDNAAEAAGRDLIFLTGTCTVAQMTQWEPAFDDAARSVAFGS